MDNFKENGYSLRLTIKRGEASLLDTSIEAETSEEVEQAKKSLCLLLGGSWKESAPVFRGRRFQKEAGPAGKGGVSGAVRLRCDSCGDVFGTFLRDSVTEFRCKCGCGIDLAAPLRRYRFTCPYCEGDGYGLTNLDGEALAVTCRCGMDVDLLWNENAREYQN